VERSDKPGVKLIYTVVGLAGAFNAARAPVRELR
jgi:uncharacterized membrane protein YuzA (DUF378 family)